MDILDFLANDNWIILNGTLADKLGIETAILVGLLSSYQRSFGGEFYRDRAQILKESHLSDYAFRKSMDKLKEMGILEVNYRGVPCRCYYKLNEEKLALQFVDRQQSSFDDFNKSSFDDFNKSSFDEIDTSLSNTDDIFFPLDNKKGNSKKDNNKETLVFGEKSDVDIMFDEFWKAYPRKEAKKAAYTAFKNIKHLKEEFPKIMKAVNIRKGTHDWMKDNGKYIPHPTTYIHQERWKDEVNITNANDSLVSSDNTMFGENVRAMLKEMGL